MFGGAHQEHQEHVEEREGGRTVDWATRNTSRVSHACNIMQSCMQYNAVMHAI